MTAVAAAAAVSARARRRVVGHLEEAGAISPETAVTFTPERRTEQRWLQRMLADGSVVQMEGERFYVDRAGLGRSQERRRSRILMALGAVGLAALVASLLG